MKTLLKENRFTQFHEETESTFFSVTSLYKEDGKIFIKQVNSIDSKEIHHEIHQFLYLELAIGHYAELLINLNHISTSFNKLQESKLQNQFTHRKTVC